MGANNKSRIWSTPKILKRVGKTLVSKKMKKLIILCTLFVLILCSCSTTQFVSYSEFRTVDPRQSFTAIPLIADLQVNETRITYSEKLVASTEKLSSSQALKLIDDLKSSVLSRAAKKYDADVIVAPIIDVQQTATNAFTISIVGYPAVYKNIRNATKDDSWFIQVEPAKQAEPTPSNKIKLLGK